MHNRKLILILAVTVCSPAFLANVSDASWFGTAASEQETVGVEKKTLASGFLVKISLPIDGRSAAQARQALQQILDASPDLIRAENRPIVVVEFDTSRGATGQGSTLGACIDLARYLSSPEMSRIKTVAYIPGRLNAPNIENVADDSRSTRLVGHAVLVAIAADQIALHPTAKIGSAGIDETIIDSFVREAYRNVASKRLAVRVAVVMAMLDKDQQLYRVRTGREAVYVGEAGLKKLEVEGSMVEYETLSVRGQPAEFSGKQLVDFGLIRQFSRSRVELARQLGIPLDALKAELRRGKPWKAVRVELPDYVDETTLQWVTRALEPKVSSGQANLIILEFDSTSGDVDACLLLARRLSAYDSEEVQTVAFINDVAAGPAALLAMSCQHVIMQNDAKLGGQFEPTIKSDRLDDLKAAAAGIAESLGKDPAVLQAMIDPNLGIIRFRDDNGNERLFTQEQKDALVDSNKWSPQGPLDVFEPISPFVAQERQLARQVVSGLDELKSFYQLEGEPELLKPTSVDRWLHRAALFLASPFVAPWLLFLAMFFLFNEVSQPGLGVPGFLGTVCLILYFWSQHLDGNANWLEIMLFAAGALFLLLEVFVVPGFGVFGIGGLLMVVVSIVLASQTFIFPTTTQELGQLPKSLFALVGAFGGMIFAMVLFRAVLPNTPFFKKIMLEPPSRSTELFDNGVDSETIVSWGHLVGQKGVAITNLAPSGKAKIAGDLMDVISDGRLIEKDLAIEVIQVVGNRVIVAVVNSGSS